MRSTALFAVVVAALAAAPALPAAAAGVLDRIKETGEIRLGIRTDAAPHSYLNANGVPSGYTVQVCNAVAAELATALGSPATPVYVEVTAQNRFDAVANGEIDLLCGAATVTLARRATVDFSIPTFVDGAAVMLPRGASPDFAALAGKRIGVRAGTTTEDSLKATLDAGSMTAFIVPLDSHAAGLKALEDGEIDAYFGDQSILYGLFFSSSKRDQLEISRNTLTVEKHALALPRGDSEFRLAVDAALSRLYRSNEMAELFRETFPGADPSPALVALFTLAPERP